MIRDDDNTLKGENPLLPLVLRLLHAQPDGISEYELLKQVEAESTYFERTSDDAQLALFQKHFLIMNALYRLQDGLWRDERVRLAIAPLRIALETPTTATGQDVVSQSDDALRAYYLDWEQFLKTDRAAVTELLASFWTRYAAYDQRDAALSTLQLGSDADWETIKRRYRSLAAATHPDRGGDAAQFLAVRAAYEALCLSER